MSSPNAYLRCESRRPRPRFALGLWKYSLALVIVASAAADALWLVPAREAPHSDASAYRDALRARCRFLHAMHHAQHAPRRVPLAVW
jgi:hypothetical protein